MPDCSLQFFWEISEQTAMSQIKLHGLVVKEKRKLGLSPKKERKETVDENSVTHCSIKPVMFENEYSNKLEF